MNTRHILYVLSALLLLNCSAFAQTFDTVSVYFDHNVRDRFPTGPIDSLISAMEHSEKVRVLGYADFLGSEAYNRQLSSDRANTVAKYIVSNGKGKLRVGKITGQGEVVYRQTETPDGDPPSRRVDVIVQHEAIVKDPEPEEVVLETPESEASFELPTSAEENIVLEGLGFIPGRHYPLAESGPVLVRLLNTMKRYPDLQIEIQGYICCEYTQFDGMDQDTGEPHLSRNRAKFVYEYLIEGGIDAERMTYKGYGSSKPKVYPEITPEDQQANRRVEIKIVK